MAQRFKTAITISELGSASSQAIAANVDGDSNNRIVIDAGGKITWGSGSAAGDTNLYRSAADVLKTDDVFQAVSGIVTLTTSGVPTATLDDGALAVDTTNDNLYLRSGGAWVSAGGTASVTVSDNAPSSPSEGDLWFESDTSDIFVYYDGVWVDIGGASVANIAMSDTPPTSPANGDFWFETDTGKTFVYYDDGTSTQWVEVGAASAAASGADGYIQYYDGGTFGAASALVWDSAGSSLDVVGDITATGTVTATGGLVTLTSSGAPTASVSDGGLAVDTTNNILYFRSGSTWQQVSAGVEISDAAPSSPNEGDLWWESDTGRLKVYYNDGTSSQWVDAFTSGAGSTGVPSLLWTQFYYDGGTVPSGSTTGTLGENHGNWYEATAANYANTGLGSNNSADDPTLTGITYSSSTGRFTGFTQGVYQVSFTGNAAIDATGLTISQQKGVDISGSGIFVDFPINILPEAAYHNYPNFETGFSLSTTVVMSNATPANNYLEVSAGTQNTWYYGYYGYLSITKIG